MPVLFLDANIFFAATYSCTGASRGLFHLAEKKKVRLLSNRYVLEEARRNIALKCGEEALIEFFRLVSTLDKVHDTFLKPEFVIGYGGMIVKKDLPVLLGALDAEVDFLVTLDQKDFMTKVLQDAGLPFRIVLPGEVIRLF